VPTLHRLSITGSAESSSIRFATATKSGMRHNLEGRANTVGTPPSPERGAVSLPRRTDRPHVSPVTPHI